MLSSQGFLKEMAAEVRFGSKNLTTI